MKREAPVPMIVIIMIYPMMLLFMLIMYMLLQKLLWLGFTLLCYRSLHHLVWWQRFGIRNHHYNTAIGICQVPQLD